jgi:serine/threonine-protein kinase
LLGQILGERFHILELMARGGMGKVYRAKQAPLGRIVALKVLDPFDVNADPDAFRQRFFLEASSCAKLTHTHTVRIFDYGNTDDDIYYIAMEHLEGRDLQQAIREDAPIDPLRLVRIMRRTCASLSEAHAMGLVHRDLKPSNIFLARHGDDLDFVKVLDFGLVKELTSEANLTGDGRLLGSPMYMSPEQVHGEPLDARADIYSLGVVMYTALTGKLPFKRANSVAVLISQITTVPPTMRSVAPKVHLTKALEWVVSTCLEKKREKRFRSVAELARALRAVEAELTGFVSGSVWLDLDDTGKVIVPPPLDEYVDMGESGTFPRMDSGPIISLPAIPTPFPPSPRRSTTAVIGGIGFLLLGILAALAAAWLPTGGQVASPTPSPEAPVEIDPSPTPASGPDGAPDPIAPDDASGLEPIEAVAPAEADPIAPSNPPIRHPPIAVVPPDPPVDDSPPAAEPVEPGPAPEPTGRTGSDVRDPWGR